MKLNDFYVEPTDMGPFGSIMTPANLNTDLLSSLYRSAVPGDDDLETSETLLRLVMDEYTLYGTDSQNKSSNEESHLLLKTLKQTLTRQGVIVDPPFRDFQSFRTYWNQNDGYGSWDARRHMIEQFFGPALDQVEQLHSDAINNRIAMPISPRGYLGWGKVDEGIVALRERFANATTVQDYKDVGNRSVGVLEDLSRQVFDPEKHWFSDEKPPAPDKTEIRIGAYISEVLRGKDNETLRGLVKKASQMAHSVKHSPNANRVSAGIIADTVILLANILRRLDEGL